MRRKAKHFLTFGLASAATATVANHCKKIGGPLSRCITDLPAGLIGGVDRLPPQRKQYPSVQPR
jgi:hypothetical protein